MQNLLNDLIDILKSKADFVVDGKLAKNIVVEKALQLDSEFLQLLLTSDSIKEHFFKKIGDVFVFDKIKFQEFVSNKEFLPNSYTSFKNQIGLIDESGCSLKQNKDVGNGATTPQNFVAAEPPAKYKVPKTKNVSIKRMAHTSSWRLQTADDVDKYLEQLRQALLKELETSDIVNIEF